ncbi:putative cytokinetic ring protein SteA [Streptosporangium sp. NBC_01639]|uniref:putative cytokinetic ring protein SteA n=1 Tax=unclassified Streptosporangium TaxID=2632669 RepID=UPI002DDBBA32|nr:putative cytokinetic ring protein SteA [Streptosporangium sp. NBC_01756]WSC87203.1 putative cytokinetic ring protein SteA [Streptosporangium sp. NBC_01756]WTD54108.1 putative cytokinetic ring protein SteA [Streptosporangium sp. NBC_01639]
MKVPIDELRSRLNGYLRRRKVTDLPGVTAVARIDRRTKGLTKRLRPGEIAIIDHVDVDRVSAEALVACGAASVVNVATGISGRYPNLGPQIIVEAGVPFIDNATSELFDRVKDGDLVRVHEGAVYLDDELVGKGDIQTAESIEAAMAEARAGLTVQIEAFAANTMEYVRRERDLLIDGIGVPDVRTVMEGRHVLIVVRGYHYKEDIAVLRPYIREYRPIMIGVDGGADALMEAGYQPDIIVGDFDSVSTKALTSGAELVVHAYKDGRAPGLERVQQLGQEAVTFPAIGTSEDIAMLLADDKGADLIVAVGTHATLVEFLDKGRSGMASTFLTRLRVGSKLVDAKGVSRLYRSRISTPSLLLLVATTLITMGVAIFFSPVGKIWVDSVRDGWNGFIFWLVGLFS